MPAFFQWRLPARSNKTEDDVINTFTFDGTFSDTMVGAAVEKISNFYNAATSNGDALSLYIGGSVSRTQPMTFKVWNVTGATTTLGEPDGEGSVSSLGGSATPAALPREVSCCLSFSAPQSSGLPPRRRRGRIYIGPLTQAASNAGVASDTGRVRPTTEVLETLLLAGAEHLGDTSVPAAVHSVWSRAGNAIVAVSEYSVDDAFDTQRRRGEDPTFRNVEPPV